MRLGPRLALRAKYLSPALFQNVCVLTVVCGVGGSFACTAVRSTMSTA